MLIYHFYCESCYYVTSWAPVDIDVFCEKCGHKMHRIPYWKTKTYNKKHIRLEKLKRITKN